MGCGSESRRSCWAGVHRPTRRGQGAAGQDPGGEGDRRDRCTGDRDRLGGVQQDLRVSGSKRLKKLSPGRYTLIAKPVGDARATDAKQSVRVRKTRGATVRFTYRGPDTTAPGPVTNVRVTQLGATSLRLAWDTPRDGSFLFVAVQRTAVRMRRPGSRCSTRRQGAVGFRPGAEHRVHVQVNTEDEAGNVSAPARSRCARWPADGARRRLVRSGPNPLRGRPSIAARWQDGSGD